MTGVNMTKTPDSRRTMTTNTPTDGVGVYAEMAAMGTATVHEASGGEGLVDVPLVQVLAGSRACGPARIAYCAQDDNLGVHEVLQYVRAGDVLVVTMPEPTPVALVGELLATQAAVKGAAALLVDGAVRDVDELRDLGLPMWARFIRVRGAIKEQTLGIDVPVTVGGTDIRPGDAVILDSDGAVVVAAARIPAVLDASKDRLDQEMVSRARFNAGELSWDISGYGRKAKGSKDNDGDQ
jgi:4-hydroxy-4-methyl-2-oxoglutarate aldolase